LHEETVRPQSRMVANIHLHVFFIVLMIKEFRFKI
jgi:hypothetical protein